MFSISAYGRMSAYFFCRARLIAEDLRILPDPVEVEARLRIARFGELREREDGDLMVLGRQDALARADAEIQLRRIDRFGEEFVRARLQALDDVRRLGAPVSMMMKTYE